MWSKSDCGPTESLAPARGGFGRPSTWICALVFGASPVLSRIGIVLLIGANSLFAQDRATGAKLLTRKQYQNLSKANAVPGAAIGEPSVNMEKEFPLPEDQGLGQSSCTSFAVAYAVGSFLQKKESGFKEFSADHVCSPSFIYNQFANDHGRRGIYIRQALNIFESGGCVSWQTMPYVKNDADTQPTEQMIDDAWGAKLVIRSDPLRAIDVRTIKSYLVSQIPCVVGANVDYRNGGEWQKNAKGVTESYLHPDDLASHCMVVIGYNDDKGAFEIMNSWGPNWNDRGYGWISYDFWPRWASEVYVVQFDPNKTHSGSIAAETPIKSVPIGPEGRSNGNHGYPPAVALMPLKPTTEKKLPEELKRFFPNSYEPAR